MRLCRYFIAKLPEIKLNEEKNKGLIKVSRKRKVNKMRGSRTHGYGSKKKHRGGGSQGGHGYGGSHKHKFSRIVTKEPWHYGYKGFVNPTRRRIRAINVEKLEMLADGDAVDLTKLGYGKLLSRGSLTKPLTVRVAAASKAAREKVEKAGGRLVLEKAEEGKDAEATKQ